MCPGPESCERTRVMEDRACWGWGGPGSRRGLPLRLVGLVLGWAIAALPVSALDPDKAITQYVQDSWEVDSGLPQNSVLDIVQTADGYLWMGSFEGLARFDGVHFEVFDKTNMAMTESAVWALLEDRQHRLWIGTDGGGLLVREGEHFSTLTADDGLAGNIVTSLAEGPDGTIWAGTRSGVTRIRDGVAEIVSLPHPSVLSLAVDAQGTAWVGTDGGGVYRLEQGEITSFDKSSGLPSAKVHAVYLDRDGVTLWAGTSGQGLAVFRNGRWEVEKEDVPGLHDIQEILRDGEGSLWAGTGYNGLFRLHGDAVEHLGARDGLTDDDVEALCEDVEGSLWLGTYRGGLDRLRDGKFVTYTTREGLSHDQVRAVFADSRGDIWLGTVGGGVNRLRAGTVEVLSTANGLSNDLVWSLGESGDGSIWIGTYGGGLNRWRDGTLTLYSTANGLSHDLIRSLMEDRDGNLWIGTNGKGIDILRPDGRIDHLTTADGLPNEFVYSIVQDSTGSIWIGTYGGGLCRIEGGSITSFGTEDGLSHAFVWTLTEDADEPGVIWAGTNGGGINRVRNGEIHAYTQARGLHNDVVFQILDDGLGRLWMSSHKGVFSITKDALDRLDRGLIERIHCASYGRSDGMRTWECNGPSSPAGALDSKGRLWFPTIKGVVAVDPDNLPVNRRAPPVVIERFVVDGQEMDRDAPIELAPGARQVEVHFTALSLLAPEKVRFRRILEGLEEEWTEPSGVRSALFSRLPPGRYTFRVIACNNDGVWNEGGASLSFSLRPFFHQTRYFYALCGCAAFALGAGVVMTRVRRLKHREKVLSRLVAERTGELARANAELERLANLDGLTGIANHRYFELALEAEWRRCRRESVPLSLVMLDVDFFKRFNDRYGHQAGDECLKAVASVLGESVHRPGDLAARYGGEEFVLVLSATPVDGAVHVAEEVRRRVEELAIEHDSGNGVGVVTLSAGVVTVVPDGTLDLSVVIGRADEALYRAKRRGRNRVEIWSESATEPS